MKVLIVDQDGVGLSLVTRCIAAGHEVRWFTAPKLSIMKETGEGFEGVKRVGNWVSSAAWADLIVPTSNDMYIPKLTALKAQGFPVFGPTTESAKLEISRGDGLKLLEKFGIESAPYEVFKSMKEAFTYVKKTEDRFVFKTLGDNEDKSLTYVSKGPADMLNWLEKRIADTPIKGDVMLQSFVEGIELGVSRFMGKKGWIGPWNESFEHKKLMSGNYGPNTGEQGTIAYFTPESKLGQDTLAKLEYALLERGHTGDVALGFMIDKQGVPRPNEWTCRLGWPIFNMMLGAVRGDPSQWMKDGLDGKDTTTFREDIGCCLVLATPPYPGENSEPEKTIGNPIYGVTNGNRKHIHPCEVMMQTAYDMDGDKMVKRPMWATSGTYNMIVTGFGKDVKQSTERAYKTVGQLSVSNMLCRDDIGEKLKDTLPILHKQGYATHCEYEG